MCSMAATSRICSFIPDLVHRSEQQKPWTGHSSWSTPWSSGSLKGFASTFLKPSISLPLPHRRAVKMSFVMNPSSVVRVPCFQLTQSICDCRKLLLPSTELTYIDLQYPAGYLQESKTTALIIITTVCQVLSTLLVSGRLYSRLYLLRTFKTDDYILVFSWVNSYHLLHILNNLSNNYADHRDRAQRS
jgi:hypothetical protein